MGRADGLLDDLCLILPACLSGGRGLDTAGVDSGELVGVGAFAQLSGLTVETLRHYHQVGLLVPAQVDDRTGYRRYGLPGGLRKNERLQAPVLTPTTKFEAHDRNLGRDDAIAGGLVTADLFDRCAAVCFRLFARGTELSARRGLILAGTKYELGLLGDEIVLIDEVHTPDSSRYWYADTYDELFRKGKDQRALDMEPLREWMAERGFRGDGQAPVMAGEVRIATAARYILLAEELTQRPFEVPQLTAAERVASVLRD